MRAFLMSMGFCRPFVLLSRKTIRVTAPNLRLFQQKCEVKKHLKRATGGLLLVVAVVEENESGW